MPLTVSLQELEDELIGIIAENIARVSESFTAFRPEIAFEKIKAERLKAVTEESVKAIAANAKITVPEAERLIKESGIAAALKDERLYRLALEKGIITNEAVRFAGSRSVTEIFTAAVNNAKTMLNLTNTGALSSARGAYLTAANQAYIETYAGVKTTAQAVMDAVTAMARSGITVVTYSGTRENGQKWERRDHIDVAVRRNLMTAINQANGKMTLARAEDWGSNLVEVSRHMGERPSHAEWSGKIYAIKGRTMKYANLYDATGYETAEGLKGVNCRHTFWAFIEGLSTRNDYGKLGYPDNDTPEGKAEIERIYKNTQAQRRYEREIRAAKREIAGLKGLGEDTGKAYAKLNNKENQLDGFLKSTRRTRRGNREQVAGFD